MRDRRSTFPRGLAGWSHSLQNHDSIQSLREISPHVPVYKSYVSGATVVNSGARARKQTVCLVELQAGMYVLLSVFGMRICFIFNVCRITAATCQNQIPPLGSVRNRCICRESTGVDIYLHFAPKSWCQRHRCGRTQRRYHTKTSSLFLSRRSSPYLRPCPLLSLLTTSRFRIYFLFGPPG